MITREQLQAAIDVCGWQCRYCDSDEITVRMDGGEWIPDTAHDKMLDACEFIASGETALSWCPALTLDSAAMVEVWLDVNDALVAAGLFVPDYGAQASYSRRVSA